MELKIRFWDKKLNVMWEPIELKKLLDYLLFQNMPNSDGYCALKDHFNEMVMLQFTGTKDCNKKEIYEGDIVKAYIYSDEKPTESEVTFTESGFGIEYEWSDGDGFYLAQFPGTLEVIGNIYEGEQWVM